MTRFHQAMRRCFCSVVGDIAAVISEQLSEGTGTGILHRGEGAKFQKKLISHVLLN